MQQIKKLRKPMIKEKNINAVCSYFYYNNYQTMSIFYADHTSREEYLHLRFNSKIQQKTAELLSKILGKNILERTLKSCFTNAEEIPITYNEFLKLYNTLVIKDKKSYIISIDQLYYKDLSRLNNQHDYYAIDTPLDLRQFAREVERNLYKIYANDLLQYYIAINEEKTEAGLYIESNRKYIVDKAGRYLNKTLRFPTKSTSYMAGKETIFKNDVFIRQFNFPMEYLNTIYVYLKLLPKC